MGCETSSPDFFERRFYNVENVQNERNVTNEIMR